MNIIIFCANKELESIQKLTDRVINAGHTLQLIDIRDFKVEQLQVSPSDIIINRISGISYDDRDLDFLKELRQDRAIINSPDAQRVFREKYSQYLFYKDHNIKTIKTLNLQNVTSESEVLEFANKLAQNNFLLKPQRSNQARGIIQCLGVSQLLKEYQKLFQAKDLRYVLQPFLEKTKEWRMLFIGNKHICTMLKDDGGYRGDSSSKENPHLSILNCESTQLKHIPENEIPREVLDMATNLSKLSKLEVMACDILTTPQGEHILIETNCVPGMKFVEKICNIDVSSEIIKLVE